jgi:hypothetical protein
LEEASPQNSESEENVPSPVSPVPLVSAPIVENDNPFLRGEFEEGERFGVRGDADKAVTKTEKKRRVLCAFRGEYGDPEI